jgi:hypothetical protein
MGKNCRFNPPCSQYALDALKKKRTLPALRLMLIRILKCHPFNPGGNDPVK